MDDDFLKFDTEILNWLESCYLLTISLLDTDCFIVGTGELSVIPFNKIKDFYCCFFFPHHAAAVSVVSLFSRLHFGSGLIIPWSN